MFYIWLNFPKIFQQWVTDRLGMLIIVIISWTNPRYVIPVDRLIVICVATTSVKSPGTGLCTVRTRMALLKFSLEINTLKSVFTMYKYIYIYIYIYVCVCVSIITPSTYHHNKESYFVIHYTSIIVTQMIEISNAMTLFVFIITLIRSWLTYVPILWHGTESYMTRNIFSLHTNGHISNIKGKSNSDNFAILNVAKFKFAPLKPSMIEIFIIWIVYYKCIIISWLDPGPIVLKISYPKLVWANSYKLADLKKILYHFGHNSIRSV